MLFGIDLGAIMATFFGLLLFGLGYNVFIAWLQERGYLEGYVSIAVVIGCVVTLIGVAFISWQSAIICLVAFVASGTPMVFGSIAQYIKKRETSILSIRKEVANDKAPRMGK